MELKKSQGADTPRRAYYDLRWQPASYDFWIWITLVRRLGARHVVFDTSQPFKYRTESQEDQQRLFNQVVLPTCDLFGLTYDVEGASKVWDLRSTHIYLGEDQFLKPEDTLQFSLHPDGPPTVTLRQSRKHQSRDSYQPVWRRFAADIGARVIEDAWVRPLALRDRFELYRRAPVNFFVSNGPGAAALFSNIPTLMFVDPASYHCRWITQGDQFSCCTDRQRIIWEKPTLDLLHQTYHAWQKNGGSL